MLKNAYSASDIFIMPNIPIPGDMEGFGIVLLEANLAGTPAVAADLEGIKDVIENGKNGYKIEVRDSKSFSNKIDTLTLNSIFKGADINFGKSDTKSVPCKTYRVVGEIYEMDVENCERVATIKTLRLR